MTIATIPKTTCTTHRQRLRHLVWSDPQLLIWLGTLVAHSQQSVTVLEMEMMVDLPETMTMQWRPHPTPELRDATAL